MVEIAFSSNRKSPSHPLIDGFLVNDAFLSKYVQGKKLIININFVEDF